MLDDNSFWFFEAAQVDKFKRMTPAQRRKIDMLQTFNNVGFTAMMVGAFFTVLAPWAVGVLIIGRAIFNR